MRQTPVNNYLEEISTELPEELYGNLSDAIYETVCEFDEDVAQLKAENDKLRNEVDNLMDFEHLTSVAVAYAGCDECGEYKQTMLRLFADNAKLRELLSVMAYCNQFRRDCDGCSMNGAAGIITERAGCDELLDRLRELGVEVDE